MKKIFTFVLLICLFAFGCFEYASSASYANVLEAPPKVDELSKYDTNWQVPGYPTMGKEVYSDCQRLINELYLDDSDIILFCFGALWCVGQALPNYLLSLAKSFSNYKFKILAIDPHFPKPLNSEIFFKSIYEEKLDRDNDFVNNTTYDLTKERYTVSGYHNVRFLPFGTVLPIDEKNNFYDYLGKFVKMKLSQGKVIFFGYHLQVFSFEDVPAFARFYKNVKTDITVNTSNLQLYLQCSTGNCALYDPVQVINYIDEEDKSQPKRFKLPMIFNKTDSLLTDVVLFNDLESLKFEIINNQGKFKIANVLGNKPKLDPENGYPSKLTLDNFFEVGHVLKLRELALRRCGIVNF